jgi:hypothetical protein
MGRRGTDVWVWMSRIMLGTVGKKMYVLLGKLGLNKGG